MEISKVRRTSARFGARLSGCSLVLLFGALGIGALLPCTSGAVEIWNGPRFTFAKANYTDWSDPTNQDRIATNVWLARKNTQGLFNLALETSYTNTSPTNTEWAYGTTDDLPLTFKSWYEWCNHNPASTVGSNAVLHIISGNIYLDVKFASFTGSNSGGGFSYERAGHVYLTLNGSAVMSAFHHVPYTDPGATATDSAGNPLAVSTNGTVDTETVGTYTQTYAAVDAHGLEATTNRIVIVGPRIWNGARITFTKGDSANWNVAANQDRITTNVWLTRGNSMGLFNIRTESAYDRDYRTSPADTEWADKTSDDIGSLTFRPWYDWAETIHDGTQGTVDQNAVVHLISDDIYIDITFTWWSSGWSGGSGGFSYERGAPLVVTLNGDSDMHLEAGDTFTDPGATALDIGYNSLAVTTNGAVDSETMGRYVLTYSATDGAGYTGSVTRTVGVWQNFSPTAPGVCAMPSYSQHSTYANAVINETIAIWGRSWGGEAPFSYTLDFGDGSTPAGGTVANPAFIGADHTYSAGGLKTISLSVTDNVGTTRTCQAAVKVFATTTHEIRVNQAIEKGLLWIYRNQTSVDSNRVYWTTGNGDEYNIGASGAAVLAFEENGHQAGGDPAKDVYAETVQRGLNWLVHNGYNSYYPVYPHSDGIEMRDPDSNGNGKGSYLTPRTYANSLATMALIMASPSAEAASNTIVGLGPFVGASYYELVQDIFDQYSFCQGDKEYRGGWRYSLDTENAPANDGGYDGSAQQWPCLNFKAAGDRWGLWPAPWVITNSVYGYRQIQNENGGCGYSDSSSGLNTAKSAGMLMAYNVGGEVVGEGDVHRGLAFIGTNWYIGNDPGWAADLYAMYGTKKALHVLGLETINTPSGDRNWYNDLSAWLLGNAESSTPEGMPFVPANLASDYQHSDYAFGQSADGSWMSGSGYITSYLPLCTPVAVLILTKTVTVSMPVAVIAPVGDQPCPEGTSAPTPFAMDGSGSYHQDTTRSIVEYLWDWNADDGVDWDNPDASGPRPTNPGYYVAGTNTVRLRVKDDAGLTATATLPITVTAEDVPPLAVVIPPGIPAYAGRIGAPILLDGSASYDPDGDTITNYTWDLNGNAVYGDTNDVSSSEPTTTVTFASTYVGAIGLQVAANGKTGASHSQVDIYATANDVSVADVVVSNLVPGVSADVHAILTNDASSAADFVDVTVRFYTGNPFTSGSQISSNYIVDMPRGIPVALDAHLDNLSGVSVSNLYFYVDANAAIPEWDETNNVMRVRLRYALTVTATPPEGGLVLAYPAPDANGNCTAGTSLTLTAVPSNYWGFAGWSGDFGGGDALTNQWTLCMDTSKSVTASFTVALTTNTATPLWWLAQYELTNNGTTFEEAATNDLDHDGFTAAQEYIAGTSPTDSLSRLVIASITPYGSNYWDLVFGVYSNEQYPLPEYAWMTNVFEGYHTQRMYDISGMALVWPSVTGRLYDVYATTNLLWTPMLALPYATNLSATTPMNNYTDRWSEPVPPVRMYRVDVHLP